MITSENIKDIFDYADGCLYWKIRPCCAVYPGYKAGGLRKGHHYETVKYQKKYYSLHRLVYLWNHGESPKLVDHINRDKLDNRIENLRAASKSVNALNSSYAKGSTGLRGVTQRGQRYEARIRKDYKYMPLGYYDTAEEASRVYEDARQAMID